MPKKRSATTFSNPNSPKTSPKRQTPPSIKLDKITERKIEKISNPEDSTPVTTKAPVVTPTTEGDANHVARTMARFYQIGFYIMLLVFVLSHLLRSIL